MICFLGLAQLDAKESGRMGSIAIGYYFATTVLAAIVSRLLNLQAFPLDSVVIRFSKLLSNWENWMQK